MRRIFVCIAGLIWLAPWLCVEASAQTAPAGTITGIVTDHTGAFVSHARIIAVEESNGTSHQTATDANGAYRLWDLPAGTYRVTIEEENLAPAGRRRPWSYRTTAEVTPSHTTRLDISLHSLQEHLISCDCSMRDETLEKFFRDASPPDPEITLHLSTDRGSVASGSEVWLTVVLTNIASHPIFIPAEKGAVPAFAYSIGVSDPCNCPIGGTRVGDKKKDEAKRDHDSGQPTNSQSGPMVSLPPGGTLTDRIEVTKLLNLTGPRTYVMRVQRPDTAALQAGEQSEKQGMVTSNRISVTMTAP